MNALDGDLEWHRVAVEDGRLDVGQLHNLAQSEVLANDILGLEELVVGVQRSKLGAGRKTAVELYLLSSR